MRRGVLAMVWGGAACAGLAMAHVGAAVSLREPPPERPESAVAAETLFFVALNSDAGRRDEALRSLYRGYREDPDDGATNLWLGMSHLWIAAEGDPADPTLLGHLYTARVFLERAARLRPDDGRIPSWLGPVRYTLAKVEGDADAAAAAEAEILRAYAENPVFHAVSLSILRWEAPRDSEAFRAGLEALRTAAAGGPDNPAAVNRPRWPHNVEGFALALAQYELKAGNSHRASVMLGFAMERDEAGVWPYRKTAEEMLDRLPELARLYADDDASNDPPYVLTGATSCRVCHQGR